MDLFATYEENCDGEGGHPLTSQVIQNFDTYTYFVTHDNKVNGESHLDFSVDAVLEKIEEIAR